ncbi:2-dehydropantoate 2-reductase [Pseudoalteromonas sp. McH1-7]|uniref:ketopantoate reductase family protein n=1 Tax=Pseudoalteromonas TaxID=53246 RepID=UPI0015920F55|nr:MULTISPECIES: 2-dehydropantoate 2-reductase [Pseudoalteromonas]MDW7550353.1 2-dehydropantoate 2-reductase [Pseudoalteromonas peptidolytica]NUZ10741.1 2-dehydropantoate 2-reductase [Pseudoalteromonas sp. McH1-7]USD28166.1 2-dehydropantoate 2-reductase [Pseudoalteromonas sp. SCSIO 43201]
MASIHIVGDGAIGLLLAQHLSQSHHVTLITRTKRAVTYHYQQQSDTQVIACQHTLSTEIPAKSIDTLIIPVKAYQVVDAITELYPKLSAHGSLILSHNGMVDCSKELAKLGSNQSAYFLSTSIAGYKIKDTVYHTGQGATWFGPLNLSAQCHYQKLFSQLFGTFKNAQTTSDIMPILWRKLAINIAINPLSALEQIKNGQLRQPKYAARILNLMNEVQFIAAKAGVNVALNELLTLAYTVMMQTAENRSSMNQDIANNRRSEIDAMCGYICKLAAKQHITVPYNQQLLDEVKKCELNTSV